MLEHGANLDGKLLAALATLLQAEASGLALQLVNTTADRAAVWARDAVRPTEAFEIFEGLGLLVEIRLR